MELDKVASDFTDALVDLDRQRVKYRHYRPGIGPFAEGEATKLALKWLTRQQNTAYGDAGPRRYPNTRRRCDLVIPGEWAIEIKLTRPFGDNNAEDEHWFENVLYPYPKLYNNDSAVSDCFKLAQSAFEERKAVLVYGFEHEAVRIPLEPTIRTFEIITREMYAFELSDRIEVVSERLVHPVHNRLRVYAWEVISGPHDTGLLAALGR